jgi:glutamate synthase domain-containing protein 3
MAGRALRLIALAASALAVASVIGPTAADATKTVQIASHISIKSKELKFSGKVTSTNSACVSGRKVTLFRTNGNVLGSTTTGSLGRWKITAQGSAGISLGHFFAKVKRRTEGTAGTIYVCKGATSPTISIHP